ncbi:MAG: right-handed parallel beta-helix repeat-containing protein [Prolixibacteraceae bacterium]|nr:right-handed parallel beta-helix repeat-containing protein [Prolixibacteraceae bacterium]
MINLTKSKLLLSFLALTVSVFCNAQPSGGPYGQVSKVYEVPKNAVHVYYVAPDGVANSQGNTIDDPTTIEEAVKKAVTGDAIILRGGTYRTGNLIFNQGITIQAYADEHPVLKGTYVAESWKDLKNGLWKITWDNLFPNKPADWWGRDRSGKSTPLFRFNDDMIFIDGKFLQSAGYEGEVDENSFYIDYDSKTVYIGQDPTDKCVEITAFNSAIIRTIKDCNGKKSDGIGPVIKGIKFTQYAYRALEIEGYEPEGIADESTFGKDVVGTVIENCEISFCSRVAGYLRGDKMVIRNCKISDTSTEGIFIFSSSDVLVEKCVFTRNNIENIDGYFPAAVKIFNQTHRVVFNDNHIVDLPNSNGVWYDVGNVDGVFINNLVENVGYINEKAPTKSMWPSQNGFFFEISKGVTCAGNVFRNCDHGLMILNSCDAHIYQNTFINSIACIGRDQRSAQGDHFGWHPATGPDVDKRVGHIFVNNLLAGDGNYNRPLMIVWQPDFMCGNLKDSPIKEFNNNIFSQATFTAPLMYWSPVTGDNCQLEVKELSDLQKYYPEYNKNSTNISGKGSIINGSYLSGISQVGLIKNIDKAALLPAKVAAMLGHTKKTKPYIGAFPVK